MQNSLHDPGCASRILEVNSCLSFQAFEDCATLFPSLGVMDLMDAILT